MKLKRIGQATLAIAASLGLWAGIAACNPGDTIDYLFVTSDNSTASCQGQISSYHVNSYSGALTKVTGSPFCSQGSNPVAEAATPNQQFLYVANRGSNSIAQFSIATNGQLAFGHSYTTPGSEPAAMAINSTGTLLFVVDFYQAAYSDTAPGPGALIVYPINSDGTLGTPVGSGGSSFTALQCFPSGVSVTANGNYVYVTNTNSYVVTTTPPTTATAPATPSSCPAGGTISGFAVGSGGALTAIAGSPFLAGSTPTGIATDPTSRFLYATDSVQNELIAYEIQTAGVLYPLPNGPFQAGTFPVNVVVDPRGEYIYVTDYNTSTISEFTLTQSTGTPSQGASATFGTAAPSPTCILVDPALGQYVYTSDFTGAYVTGAQLNPNTGALTGIQDSPYPADGTPTCVAAVPHGNHATQYVSSTSGN
jgi:6-phosphogluconolactonase